MGWGSLVVEANFAGLIFLVAAVGPGALLAFIDELVSEPRPFDWPRAGEALIVVLSLAGAVGFVRVGLWAVDDFLPSRWVTSRPLAYALTAIMIPVLAVVAIPLLPITVVAMLIVRIAGPVLDGRLTKNCVGCAYVRSRSRANDGPVFCERHDRFFGGNAYRLLLSNEGE